MMPGDVKAAREVAEEMIRHWRAWGLTATEANVALGYAKYRRGWGRVRGHLIRWWLRNHDAA
ncbi:MAG TPA: hypothetical protein VNH39_01200 [Steroidobacteraceae bacterium]|nr:hypothetical protein [Steroidobacteraceae bacterium]